MWLFVGDRRSEYVCCRCQRGILIKQFTELTKQQREQDIGLILGKVNHTTILMIIIIHKNNYLPIQLMDSREMTQHLKHQFASWIRRSDSHHPNDLNQPGSSVVSSAMQAIPPPSEAGPKRKGLYDPKVRGGGGELSGWRNYFKWRTRNLFVPSYSSVWQSLQCHLIIMLLLYNYSNVIKSAFLISLPIAIEPLEVELHYQSACACPSHFQRTCSYQGSPVTAHTS